MEWVELWGSWVLQSSIYFSFFDNEMAGMEGPCGSSAVWLLAHAEEGVLGKIIPDKTRKMGR